MKTMYLYIIIALISFTSISCEEIDVVVDQPDSVIVSNNSISNAARYENILNDMLAAGTPGVSLTVSTPEGIWSAAGGKADLKNKVDLVPEHTMRIGSVSKLFGAATILCLQDEVVLSVDDKINEYIPRSITDEISNANKVTIRQLMNHSSGIAEYLDLNAHLEIQNLSSVKKSARENLKSIYGKEAAFSPGTSNEYCNSNYLLIGLVIKYSTNRDAFDVIKEKIIDKLNLNYTYASTVTPQYMTRAYYDIYDNGFMKDVTQIDNNAVGGSEMTDGGMISNSYDLNLFTKALMDGTLLSENSLNQMLTFEDIDMELGDLDFLKDQGLGPWRMESDYGEAYGHYGHVYGFSAVTCYFPDQDITISMTVNGGSAKIYEAFQVVDFWHSFFED